MECEVEPTRRRTAIHTKTWIATHATYVDVVSEEREGSWKREGAAVFASFAVGVGRRGDRGRRRGSDVHVGPKKHAMERLQGSARRRRHAVRLVRLERRASSRGVVPHASDGGEDVGAADPHRHRLPFAGPRTSTRVSTILLHRSSASRHPSTRRTSAHVARMRRAWPSAWP